MIQIAVCSDRKDKIFGLLSLACPCCKIFAVVDYLKSLFQICSGALQRHRSHHSRGRELEIPNLNDMIHSLFRDDYHEDAQLSTMYANMKSPLSSYLNYILYTSPCLEPLTREGFIKPNRCICIIL